MMMISRDNINNYARNLCSGDYLTAFIQFSFAVHANAWMFLIAWFFRETMLRCVHVCVCVNAKLCTSKVHRIDGHYSFCHSLLATITSYWSTESDKEQKNLCVIYMEMNDYFDRSAAIAHTHTRSVHVRFIYRFQFLPHSALILPSMLRTRSIHRTSIVGTHIYLCFVSFEFLIAQ